MTRPVETPAGLEDAQALPQEQPARTIDCANCQHRITSPGHATTVDGSHQRTFRNPAGYSFHVLCFAEAEGCEVKGRPTTADSWFEGTAWAFAFCSACGQHLGWHYTRQQAAPFYGLIAPRLSGWK